MAMGQYRELPLQLRLLVIITVFYRIIVTGCSFSPSGNTRTGNCHPCVE